MRYSRDVFDVIIATGSISRVGDRLTRTLLPRLSSSPGRVVGLRIGDASASHPRSITSRRDHSAATTPRRTHGPRARRATGGEAIVIRSNWRNLLGLKASPSRSVGDDLADLIEEYLIESTHWRAARAEMIRDSAGSLWSVRDEWMSGAMSDDDALIWIDAAHRILYETQRERSRANHPAGKGRP